jgi:hypothetical protein
MGRAERNSLLFCILLRRSPLLVARVVLEIRDVFQYHQHPQYHTSQRLLCPRRMALSVIRESAGADVGMRGWNVRAWWSPAHNVLWQNSEVR